MKVLGEKYEASTTEFISVETEGTYTFYEKLYKYVTYDNVNWKITNEYIQGEQLSATLVENGTMCEGVNEYKRMEYTIDKYSIQTNIFTKGDLITENSVNCQIVEIEWIGNTTGGSGSNIQQVYFDTGILITNKIKFQIKFKLIYSSGGLLVGDPDSSDDDNDYRMFNFMSDTIYYDIGSGRISIPSSSAGPTNSIYELECAPHYIKSLTNNYIGGSVKTSAFTRNNNLHLFRSDTNDTDGAYVYYLKVYDNDTLVRDFVPALNSNNQAGLYDKVTKQFYLPSGTGTLYHS